MWRHRQWLEFSCHSQECQEPPEAGIGKGGFSCKSFRESMALPIPWFHTSHLQNSERIHFCCFRPPVWIICYGSLSKLIYTHKWGKLKNSGSWMKSTEKNEEIFYPRKLLNIGNNRDCLLPLSHDLLIPRSFWWKLHSRWLWPRRWGSFSCQPSVKR